MGKRIIITGADFHINAVETGPITYRTGQVITPLWVTNGTKFTIGQGYSIVAFPVTPGESYSIITDRTSTAIAFSAVLPADQVAYVGGTRYVATPDSPLSGIVPTGAAYMAVVQNAPDVGNLFPSSISIGQDIVRVSDYR